MQQGESADADHGDGWHRSWWWQDQDTGAAAWWNSTWGSQDWAEDKAWQPSGSGSELEQNRKQHDDVDNTRDVVCTPTTECAIPEATASSSRRQTTSCKHWLQGRCQWSTKCRFKHEHDTPFEDINQAEPATENSDGAFVALQRTSDQPRTEVEVSVETVPEITKVKTRPRRPPARLWCQILLHKQHSGFDLIPMLIGRAGCHMREIHAETRAKVRIRGRGSGYLEVDGKREAPVPLMVVVTADKADTEGFKKAISMTLERLKAVDQRYHAYCSNRGITPVSGRLYSIGERCKGSETLLAEDLAGLPVTPSHGQQSSHRSKDGVDASRQHETQIQGKRGENLVLSTAEHGSGDSVPVQQGHEWSSGMASHFGYGNVSTNVWPNYSQQEHHQTTGYWGDSSKSVDVLRGSAALRLAAGEACNVQVANRLLTPSAGSSDAVANSSFAAQAASQDEESGIVQPNTDRENSSCPPVASDVTAAYLSSSAVYSEEDGDLAELIESDVKYWLEPEKSKT